MEIRERAICQLRAATKTGPVSAFPCILLAAAEADKNGDLQDALEKYKAGLTDLLQAIKREY